MVLLFVTTMAAMVISASSTVVAPMKPRTDLLNAFVRASNGFDMRGIVQSDVSSSKVLDGPILSNEAAFWVGVGFGSWLQQQQQDSRVVKVGIGRDSRASGSELTKWLAGGVEAIGGQAYDVGLCTTPAMYLSCTATDASTGTWPFTGAISVTASHLPSQWNGMKFFTPDTPSNIGEVGIAGLIDCLGNDLYDDLRPQPSDFQQRACSSFLSTYSSFLQKTVMDLYTASHREDTTAATRELPLKGLKIVVNAGNGAGGFLAQTLAELGADTTASIHLDPDGTFPNHVANPEDKKAIQATADAVVRSKADLGVCLDTDADRVGLVEGYSVGEGGQQSFQYKLLNRNCLVGLVAMVALRGASSTPSAPSSTLSSTPSSTPPRPVVVTDSATSNGITSFIEDTLGGSHMRYKKGYRFVIEMGRSIPGCVAAVECSGHGAWADNGWIDDGSYTAVKLITELAIMRRESSQSTGRLSDLLAGLEEPVESVELRFRVTGGPSMMSGGTEKALAALRSVADVPSSGWEVEKVNYEGLRINFCLSGASDEDKKTDQKTGWAMLRPSLHEPILSMQIESDQAGGLAVAARSIWELGAFSTLSELMDVEPLSRLAQ